MASEDLNPFNNYLESGRQEFVYDNAKKTDHVVYNRDESIKLTEQEKKAEHEQNKRKTPNWISETILKCDRCPFNTFYKCDFRRHKVRHVTAKFPCGECCMPFATKGHLRSHCRIKHGMESTAYDNKEDRQRIQNRKYVNQWRRCEKCDYATLYTNDMKKHMRRHNGECIECRYCGRPFSFQCLYQSHLRRQHGGVDTEVNGYTQKKVDQPKNTSTSDKFNRSRTDTDRKIKVDPVLNKRIAKTTERYERSIKETNVKQTTSESPKCKKQKSNAKKAKMTDTVSDYGQNEINHKKAEEMDKTQRIKCVFCNFDTTTYRDLKKHLDEHDTEKVMKTTLITETVSVETRVGFAAGFNAGPDEVRDTEKCIDAVERSWVGIGHGYDNQSNITESRKTEKHRFTFPENDLIANRNIETDTEVTTRTLDGKYNGCCSYQEQTSKQKRKLSRVRQADVIGTSATATGSNAKQKETNEALFYEPFACSYCNFKTGDIEKLIDHTKEHASGVGEKENIIINNEMTSATVNLRKSIDTRPTFQRLEKRKTSIQASSLKSKSTQTHKGAEVLRNVDVSIQTETENVTEIYTQTNKTDTYDPINLLNSPVINKTTEINSLTGRLTKKQFRRNKAFYAIVANETGESHELYECLICKPGTLFETIDLAKVHYKLVHDQLKEKICANCMFCSAPFPH